LFTELEKGKAGDLVSILKEANQSYPSILDTFGPSIHKKKEHKLYGAFFKESSGPTGAPKKIVFDD
jgi:ATP-dependent RNA helicase DBP3